MVLARRRRLLPGVLLGCAVVPLLALGGSGGAWTPRAAARAWLEASFRGDDAAVRNLTVRPEGTDDEALDRAIEARFAVWRAVRRVERAMTDRWGAGAAEAAGLSRRSDEEVRAVDSAPLERDGGTAIVRVPGRRPLVLERRWGTWKVRVVTVAQADAWEQRMRTTAQRAPDAADEAIRAIETGACGDARCAAAVFNGVTFGHPERR